MLVPNDPKPTTKLLADIEELHDEVGRWHTVRLRINERRKQEGKRKITMSTLPWIMDVLADCAGYIHYQAQTP